MSEEKRPDLPGGQAGEQGDGVAPNAERAPPIARSSQQQPRIAPRSPRARLEPERMAAPAKYSKRARHPIVIIGNAIFTTIILLAIVTGLTLVIGKSRFEAAGPLQNDRVVNIPRGAGVRDIADLLQREGVIDQPWVFIGGVLATKSRDELKSGEYQFAKQASLRDVLDTIAQGKIVQHQITIPEGLTSEQIVARLLENDLLTGPVKEIPREGTLLPETYRVVRGTPREQVIQRMQESQRRVLAEVWERRSPDLPIKSPEQLTTLASIVEKETGRHDERTRVAAVFVNRLKQRMKLESDPTIIYGLVGGKGSLGRGITRSEITQPTPYNTYVIEGLPPGPIANPGRASIEAAASPSRTKEIFFVADGTGGHAFAETYDQHQRNVARWRQIERDAGRSVPDAPSASAFAPTPPAAAPAPANPTAGSGTPGRNQPRTSAPRTNTRQQ
ncbi:MAG: hypothetical protein QOD74_2498 [Variibacter sp.]|jgi:UPF0755 protein|nr:hypothetical protein [Variibacter sp.]